MIRTLSLAALAAAIPLAAVSAQAPMEDVLWVASRGSTSLTKYSRYGKVLATVPLSKTPRRVHRAPDGKLWVIEFISSTFSIHDRDGKLLKTVTPGAGGNPYGLAFDKRGYAYMTSGSTVQEYKPDGTYVRSVNVPASPLGIAIDYSTPQNMGNIWLAHRIQPGQITKIPISTFKPQSFTLPSSEPMMPTAVVCTYEGVAQQSNVFVGGDRSDKLYKLDQAGKITGPITTAAGYNYCSGMAIDRQNRLWTVGRPGVVAVIDTKTNTTTTTFNGAPTNNDCGGVVMDSIGRPWILDRGFSSASTFRRYDDKGNMELGTPAGTNTYGMVDAAGFAYAFVVNPFGDEDKDGAANFAEITAGTSPYDALSTPSLSFDTRGVSRVGTTPYLEAVSQAKGTMVVFFTVGTGKALTLPGFKGSFLLDPATLFYTAAMPSPGKLNLPIPGNTALTGLSYDLQGLFWNGAFANLQFTNVSGIYISK